MLGEVSCGLYVIVGTLTLHFIAVVMLCCKTKGVSYTVCLLLIDDGKLFDAFIQDRL